MFSVRLYERSCCKAILPVFGSFFQQIWCTLLQSWVNVLLPCVPAGLILQAYSGPATANLVLSFLGVIPLLGLGDKALDVITSKVGSKYGTLLYISASNVMLVISSISLIRRHQIVTLQESLVGSMLANVMLLPAFSILYSAYHHRDLAHTPETTRISIMFMLLAVAAFFIPTVFDAQTNLKETVVSALSRGTSLILILAYGGYLAFNLFQQSQYSGSATDLTAEPNHQRLDPVIPSLEEHHKGQRRLWISLAMFVGLTTLSYFVTDNIVGSIQILGSNSSGNKFEFGYIIFPVLNCDLAAIEQAERSMDLMLSVTVGKSIQTALFVAPLLVVTGWAMGLDELNLSFDITMVVALLVAVFWLTRLTSVPVITGFHGLQLLAMYLIIATSAWSYPLY